MRHKPKAPQGMNMNDARYTIDGEGPWTLASIIEANADAPLAAFDVACFKLLEVGEGFEIGGGASAGAIVARVAVSNRRLARLTPRQIEEVLRAIESAYDPKSHWSRTAYGPDKAILRTAVSILRNARAVSA